MTNNTYAIIRLNKNNLADVEQLHFEVYAKRLPGYFEKKYDTAYTPAQYIGFIAYNEEEMPIAFYGVIPCFLWYDGKPVLSAQSADTMTHPQYRNRGLFVELAEQTYQLCREVGIGLVFGFPNQHSLPGLIHKLGWQRTEPMDYFLIPVHTLPLEKIAGKIPVLKKIYRAYIHSVLRKYASPATGVASSVAADGFNSVWRNDAYLNYKTYNETTVITIEQTSIWMRINNGMIIGDMLGVTADNFNNTIHQLLKLAQKMGLQHLQFHTSQGTSLHTLFSSYYQAVPAFTVVFKVINTGIDFNTIRFTFADIDIF